MPLFVWVKGLTGPQPQIWHVEQTTGEGKSKDCLQEHKISKEEADKKDISELMKVYPYVAASSSDV